MLVSERSTESCYMQISQIKRAYRKRARGSCSRSAEHAIVPVTIPATRLLQVQRGEDGVRATKDDRTHLHIGMHPRSSATQAAWFSALWAARPAADSDLRVVWSADAAAGWPILRSNTTRVSSRDDETGGCETS